jgi:hypothetical protein
MTSRGWTSSRAWILAPFLACIFVLWTNTSRIQRIERVSQVGAEALKLDATSPTGYQRGLRKLIVPEHNALSYQWIIQTQQMFARGDWRVRHVDYDNAPIGRDSHNASLYRWWLGAVAKSFQLIGGKPIGVAVESAALWAGPLLHVLALISLSMMGSRWFGPLSGAVLALGLAMLFPLGGLFLAGQPDDFALSCAIALGGMLALVAGVQARESMGRIAPTGAVTPDEARVRLRFLLAGILGGAGLWINARIQVPVLIGIVIGAVASILLRKHSQGSELDQRLDAPWRTWALSGAITSVTAYLIEYFPSHLDVQALRLEVNHPLYALAWLGAGELIHRCQLFAATRRIARRPRDLIFMVGAVVSWCVIPVTVWLHSTNGFLATGPADLKLAPTTDAPIAANIWEWFHRDGLTAVVIVTLLPLVILLPALGVLVRNGSRVRPQSTNLLLALGPVIIVLILACFRVRFWGLVDAMLLALIVVGLSARPGATSAGTSRRIWIMGAVLCFAPGLWLMQARVPVGAKDAVTELEAQSLVERDLAHWLSDRGGDDQVVVLAPPVLTSSLVYFGAVRGLATPFWENFDGFAAAVRIAGATSMAEADSLMRRREVRYIVNPSWDSDLASYAALGTTDVPSTLIGRIGRWLPPLSLRPVAYKLPQISGFEGRSIAVFAFTDMQDDALALSRLAEYFVEMAQLDFALRVSSTLQVKYPEDLNGMIARAQVAAGANDVAGFGEALKPLLPTIERGDDEGLPWDRRVSLAIVLAQAKRPELARKQLAQCLDEMDETLLRSLSTGSLYRLLMLMQRLDLALSDVELRELAHQLLPMEMRTTLN